MMAMKHFSVCAALAGTALCATGPAQAAPVTLADCRAIVDAPQRLACYDALPIAATPTPTLTSTPEPSPAQAGATASAPPPEPAGGWFGLSRPKAAETQIASTIPGHFTGWQKGSTFKLANGQVWQASDDDSGAYQADDPKVTIAPGMLGAYFLTIESLGVSFHVRRLQ